MASESHALRRDALTAFLAARLDEGYLVETRTDTQAVIVQRGGRTSFFGRFPPWAPRIRKVVAVDATGEVTIEPAVPLRS